MKLETFYYGKIWVHTLRFFQIILMDSSRQLYTHLYGKAIGNFT